MTINVNLVALKSFTYFDIHRLISANKEGSADLKNVTIFRLMVLSQTLACEDCEILFVGMEAKALSLED